MFMDIASHERSCYRIGCERCCGLGLEQGLVEAQEFTLEFKQQQTFSIQECEEE